MKKNTKKKFRDIRNAVVMMCVMVAMMSTASYAWFTMSDSPTVTGMKMTATTAGGGLEVANVVSEGGSADTYASSIIIKDTAIKTLKPVTPDTTTVGAFLKPVYQGNTVKQLTKITDTTELKNYVAKYEFWLHSKSNEEVNVGIVCGSIDGNTSMGLNGNIDGGTPNIEGSFVRKSLSETSPDTVTINPAYAIRVGFVISEVSDGGTCTNKEKLIIWEPNADAEDASAEANHAKSEVDNSITEDIAVRSQRTGKIMDANGDPIDSYTSDTLFTMSGNTAVRIVMYVWLQGSDPACGNEIQAGHLEAQVQFTTVDGDSGDENTGA